VHSLTAAQHCWILVTVLSVGCSLPAYRTRPNTPVPAPAASVSAAPSWAVHSWRDPEVPGLGESEAEAARVCRKQRGSWGPVPDGWYQCSVWKHEIFSTKAKAGILVAVHAFYAGADLSAFHEAFAKQLKEEGERYAFDSGVTGWLWKVNDRILLLTATETGVSIQASVDVERDSQAVAQESTLPSITPEVRTRLEKYDRTLADRGLTRLEVEPVAFNGREKERRSFEFSTKPDACYVVLVMGGPGVIDSDIAVQDANGNALALDAESDRDALAGFCTSSAATVSVSASIYSGSGALFLVSYAAGDEPAADVSAWPAWTGPRPDRPHKVAKRRLTAAELYKAVSPAIYVVVSGENLGSAVAISSRHLLTNCHVIGGPQTFLKRGDRMSIAHVVRADRSTDRCILSTEDIVLTPVRGIRPFAQLHIGEVVYAIGAPRGHEGSLSNGLVSRFDKRENVNVIQTTAAISPGSSGGPLFDEFGNLIGITTFYQTNGQSLNFALAADEWWN
jgi:hypothetical protein